ARGRRPAARTASPATPARTPRTARRLLSPVRRQGTRAARPAAPCPGRPPAARARPPPAVPRSARCPGTSPPGRHAATWQNPVRDAGCRSARWSPGGLSAGPVELTPFVAVPDDGFQVLLPDDAVRYRILDNRAGDAARHVCRAERPVPEMRGERQPAGDHGDRFRGRQ